MRHRHLLAAVSLLALAGASAAAAFSAHPPQEIRIGDVIQGQITPDDQFIGGEDMRDDAPEVYGPLHHYDRFVFDARAGQRLEVILRSDDFDSYLELGMGEDFLQADDDGLGEGLHSRLRFTAPEDGRYHITARSLFPEEGLGNYTLSLQERPPAPPEPRPTPVRIGASIDGELGDNDPESERGEPYDVYSLRLRAGEQVLVQLSSLAFDAWLEVGRGAGPAFEQLAMNDDFGGSLDSGVLFTAPSSGEYLIRASSFWDGQGAYTLSVQTPPPPAPVAALALGQSVNGELTEDDPLNLAGRRHDAWGFHAQAGQRIAVEMRSTSFDTYLVLGREGPGGFETLTEDDDGLGEGLNSRIVWTIEETGDYVIQARAFSESSVGAYSLSLNEIAPPPPPSPIAFGQTIQGEIDDNDGMAADGRRVDEYLFSGVAGQRIQAIMRSGDFDSYLEISHAGGEFVTLQADDDGLGEGLDSRLNYTLPSSGDYVLRAAPLGISGRGLYALQLVDRGPEPAPGSLIIGATARGMLEETDSIADDGSFYDAYRFRARAGDKLRMTMVSNEFDAMLFLGRQDGDGPFQLIASDDDSLSDTHSLIEHTIEADGWYVLRANSYAPNRTGYYTVTVERQP